MVGRAYPIPGQLFRAGDFLAVSTTGSLTSPAPAGALKAVIPTAVPVITIATGGTGIGTNLYGFYTYTDGASSESLPSGFFQVKIASGSQFTVTVPSAGAPAAAVDFNVYLGYAPFSAFQQTTATALGSATGNLNGTLTNFTGCKRAATNASANILGIALDDYDVLYEQGNATTISGNQRVYGADLDNFDPEQYQVKFAKLVNGQKFTMSILQAFNNGLIQTTFGLNQTTQGGEPIFIADNAQSNKILTCISADDNLDNWPISTPFLTGIVGVQAVFVLNSGGLQ